MIVRLLIAFVLGALAYFLAHLVFNEPISMLIAVLVGVVYFFGQERL
jgi:hypothetical protein